VAWDQAACPQGEPLTWLDYDGRAGEHWFGVGAQPELCRCCWEAARCPQQFAHQPGEHETLLGRLPLASRLAQQMLQQVRPWIEPAQSFEKNQLGLGDVFFNSLRFTWAMALHFESIKIGMTRSDLEGRLPKDGGLQSVSPVRFAHPACGYFKIDVEFDFKPNPADQNRAVWGKDDKATKVSKPYIERPFSD
jgi:hypothetical protein